MKRKLLLTYILIFVGLSIPTNLEKPSHEGTVHPETTSVISKIQPKVFAESETLKPIESQQPKPQVSISYDKESLMAAAGIKQSDYRYVDYILTKESGWRHTAVNPSSGAYGLCQALPGTKMATAGSDWKTNPVTQLKWCNWYAHGRYSGWSNAYNFWLRSSWW